MASGKFGDRYGAALLSSGRDRITARHNAGRGWFLGGDALEGPRHIWWDLFPPARSESNRPSGLEDGRLRTFLTNRFIPVPGVTTSTPLAALCVAQMARFGKFDR